MKKILFVLLLIQASQDCSAQYYSVNDPDSFVNVREQPNPNSKTIAKLRNGAIVFESYSEDIDEKSNWVFVEFYLKETNTKKNPENFTLAIMKGFVSNSGYIYKSKLTAIEKLKPLKYKATKNGYSCFNDTIKVSVAIAPFIFAKHSIQYSKENEGMLEKVDKLPMIGTDGGKPQDEIKSITLSINNTPFSIPASAYKNLFNPSYKNDAYADKNGNIYLVMYNSDAAGYYSCIFVFKNGKFIQRLVFEGGC